MAFSALINDAVGFEETNLLRRLGRVTSCSDLILFPYQSAIIVGFIIGPSTYYKVRLRLSSHEEGRLFPAARGTRLRVGHL
jgi:hypothetical protein